MKLVWDEKLDIFITVNHTILLTIGYKAKMKSDISSKDLAKCAKQASQKAVKQAQAEGISYTTQEGKNIVRHASDGTTQVIGSLSKAYVRPAMKKYKLA